MNAYALLAGLLMLAWVGGALVRRGHQYGSGLSSGSEFLLIGVLLGPLGLGAVTRPTLEILAPLTLVAASWLAFIAGNQLGYANRRRVPFPHLLLGLALGVGVFAAVAAASWWLAPRLLPLSAEERMLLAIGLGCAGCETARTAMFWGVHRLPGSGPLHDVLANLAGSDDMVPLAGLAVLFALHTQSDTQLIHDVPLIAIAVTIGLGVAAGILVGLLTRLEHRQTERWGILLGSALMATGLSALLGLAAPATLAVMGMTMNLLARDSAALRTMLQSTTRAVLLPVVALAGAQLDLRDGQAVWILALLVPLLRFGIKIPVIALLRERLAPPVVPSRWAGMALMACGSITICVGVVMNILFPGPVGRIVLAACIATIIIGELLGPPALRHELKRAGEWPENGRARLNGRLPSR